MRSIAGIVIAVLLVAACGDKDSPNITMDAGDTGVTAEVVDQKAECTPQCEGKDSGPEVSCVPECYRYYELYCDNDDGCGGNCPCPAGYSCTEPDAPPEVPVYMGSPGDWGICFCPDEDCPTACQEHAVECGLVTPHHVIDPQCDCGPCPQHRPLCNEGKCMPEVADVVDQR